MNGGKIAFFAFAINHDGAQDRERNAGPADGPFGREFRPAIGVVRPRRIFLAQFPVGKRAGLRGNGRNEDQMPDSAAGCGLRQRGRGLVIDPVIEVVNRKFVSDSGKMDDDVTLLQQRLPVERLG